MKLFVANLPRSTQINDLFTMFSMYGELDDIRIWKDRKTGQTKGYVIMEDDDDAARVIRDLDGFPWRGATLTVREARFRLNPGRS